MENELTSLPIAKEYTLEDLPGWLAKTLVIPAGKKGIVMNGSGNCKVIPSGQSVILGPLARLRGKGIGMHVGILPDGGFDVNSSIQELKCGDNEFLDVDLRLRLKITDKCLFFIDAVIPEGQFTELPEFGKLSIRADIEEFVIHYTRDDLINHVPTERLITEIRNKCSMTFQKIGLELVEIPLLLLQRSEDRMLLEEKMIELESKLQETQKDTAEKDDSPVKIEEVAHQLFPDSISLRSGERKPFSETIEDLQNFRKITRNPKQHWLLRSLQTPKTGDIDSETRKGLNQWRSLEVSWIILLLLIGVFISFLLARLNMRTSEIIPFLLGIWGTIISLMIGALRKIVEKQEKILAHSKKLADLENVHLITQEDRVNVDQLIRQQCANEIQHTREIMNEARGLIYKAGNTELALRIREFEKNLDEKYEKFLNPSIGAPFYLSEMVITDADWKRVLDQEEEILKQAKSLGSMAEIFRFAAPNVESGDFEKIEQQLFMLETVFYGRSRLN